MRKPEILLAGIAIIGLIFSATFARAEGNATTLNFAVTRNGAPIGSTTVTLHRSGDQTVAETATTIQVKIAFMTVYRYEQRLTERWSGDRLAALNAVTDENGTVHRVSATRAGDRLSVEADGAVSQIDAATIPANLWNASLVRTRVALDPKDGSVTPVSVVDRGEERVVVHGRAQTAHRYSIRTTIPQEVWYDEHQRLLKVELRGSDGSMIETTRSAT